MKRKIVYIAALALSLCCFFNVYGAAPVTDGDTANGYYTGEVSISIDTGSASSVKLYNGRELLDEKEVNGSYSYTFSSDYLAENEPDGNVYSFTAKLEGAEDVQISFKADSSLPAIKIEGTEKGGYKEDATFRVKLADGNLNNDEASLVIKKDGETVFSKDVLSEINGYRFTTDGPGKYVFNVKLKDGVREVTKAETIYIDNTLPQISSLIITGNKEEGFEWFKAPINVNFSATDNAMLSGYALYVNGNKLAEKELKTGTIEESVAITKDFLREHPSLTGRYSVRLVVTDIAGNVAEREESFTCCVLDPAVIIQGPAGNINTPQKVTIKGSLNTQKIEYSVKRNGAFVLNETSTEQVEYTPDADGKYVVTATAYDKSGNASVAQSHSFTLDTTSPKVTKIEASGDKREGASWFYGNMKMDITASEERTGITLAEIYINGEKVSEGGFEGNSFEKTILLPTQFFLDNESADGKYDIGVVIKDGAGNMGADSSSFYLDAKAPSISLSGVTKRYCNFTPNVTAKARDNYPEKNKITLKIEREGALIKTESQMGESLSTSYFEEDGSYKVTASCVDMAGNESATESITFIKDTVPPKVSLTGAKEGSFINRPVTLKISIEEKYWEEMSASVNGQRDLDGEISDASFNINSDGEKFSMTKRLTANGTYKFSLTAKDPAGNVTTTIPLTFTIDTEKPKVEIKDVKAEAGYSTVIAPLVTYEDIYFKSAKVNLVKKGGSYDVMFKDKSNPKGGSRKYQNFKKIFLNDGCYTLSCTATDKAGNSETKSVDFKINRFGSAWELGKNTKDVKGEYLRNLDKDLGVTEFNVTGILKSNVLVTKDGATKEGKYTLEEGMLSNGSKTYKYHISSENFLDEGVYSVNVTSTDTVGNFSEMIEAEGKVTFSIDRTPPVIVLTGAEDGGTYEAARLNVRVTDTIGLSGYEVYADDELIGAADKEKAFNLPEGRKMDIKVVAKDKAGNTSQEMLTGITVSGSFLTRLFAGPAGFIIAGALLLGIAGAVFVILRRRRRK